MSSEQNRTSAHAADLPRHAWSPYFVLTVALVVTLLVTYFTSATIDGRDRLRFENAVRRTQSSIQNRLDTYIALLRAGGALFAAPSEGAAAASGASSVARTEVVEGGWDGRVRRQQFRIFVERLRLREQYPGIQGIGFSARVGAAEKERFSAEMRSVGVGDDFRIQPDGERDEYHSIIYLEPLERRNQAAIGFDMFTEPVRRAAMERARDTAEPAASGRVTLVQEIDEQKQAGFLIYLPVYANASLPETVEQRRAALEGFVYSPFRVDDFLRHISDSETNPIIHFQVFDGDAPTAENLLHDSRRDSSENAPPRFTASTRIDVAGRPWTLLFSTQPEFERASNRWLMPFLPLGGLIISIVLFLVTRSQAQARRAAERAAADLSQSEARFRTVIEQAPLSTQIFSPDGRTLEVNSAWEQLWGVTLEQLGDYNILKDEQLVSKGIMPYIKRGFEGEATEIPAVLYDVEQTLPGLTAHPNPQRWVKAFIYPVRDGEGRIREVVLVHEDISEQRRTETDLQESEARFRTLIEATFDGIVIHENGIILDANRGFAEMFGYASAGEMMGKSVLDLVIEEAKSQVIERIRSNNEEPYKITGLRQDGTTFYLEVTGKQHVYRGRQVRVSALRDITERERAEEALRQSEERYRAFINQSSEGIWRFELDQPLPINLPVDDQIEHCYRHGYLAECNRVMSRMYGYNSPEDIVGARLGDFLVRTAPENIEYLTAFIRSGYSLSGAESHEIDREGRPKWFLNNLIGIVEDGRVVRAWGTQSDITERRRAEEALRVAERRALTEYKALLGRIAPLAQALGTTRDLHTIYRSLLDFTLASMPCIGYFIALYDAVTDARIAVFAWGDGEEADVSRLPAMPIGEGPNSRAVRTKQVVITDDYLAATQGHPSVPIGAENGLRPRSSLAVPMNVMGRIVGTIEVQSYEPSSYTKEHATALELAANLAAVAIENVRLFDLESRARAEAEAANRLKDEFLATLSHELRTPLTSILGWSRLMRSENFDDRMRDRAVETIERNARAQTQLIDDLLDVSRIITGKLRLNTKPLELAPIIEAAVDSARPAADAKGVLLRVLLDPSAGPITGDAERLQQVIWNLLSNAIKFTPQGGRVEVRLKRAATDGQAEIIVTDTGQGISPEFMPHVFERFRQADGAITRLHGGLGLGLAIVRHLIEQHGGTIHAESPGENLGSTFTVRLPLITTARAEAASGLASADGQSDAHDASGASQQSLEGVRVLVVEDDEDTRVLLAAVLQKSGAGVTGASSVREALETIERAVPDVLLADIGMPGEDGYELIRKVRALPAERGGRIPAAALTAYARSEDRQRALREGYHAHIAKPVEPSLLTAIVADLAAGRNGKN